MAWTNPDLRRRVKYSGRAGMLRRARLRASRVHAPRCHRQCRPVCSSHSGEVSRTRRRQTWENALTNGPASGVACPCEVMTAVKSSPGIRRRQGALVGQGAVEAVVEEGCHHHRVHGQVQPVVARPGIYAVISPAMSQCRKRRSSTGCVTSLCRRHQMRPRCRAASASGLTFAGRGRRRRRQVEMRAPQAPMWRPAPGRVSYWAVRGPVGRRFRRGPGSARLCARGDGPGGGTRWTMGERIPGSRERPVRQAARRQPGE